jgi:hypothetical protein
MVNLHNVCPIFDAFFNNKKLTPPLFTARKRCATTSSSQTKGKSKESEDTNRDDDASKKGQISELITNTSMFLISVQAKRNAVLSVIQQLSTQMAYLWM